MPAPGDQHTYVANPYAEQPQRISEFTAQEIAALQIQLDKQLGPEYLSSRSGPGGQRLQYISADKCINLANEVFGFNGWSSSIQYIHVDFEDVDPKTEKVSLGVTVIVRVTLRDGTYHEDVGFGQIDNCKSKATAYEKAKKEGTTDALKRALRQFGNVLGNCIYDKTYLQKISRVKAMPARFDENALHRHPDFVPKPAPETTEAPKSVTTARPDNPAPPAQFPNSDAFDDLLGELDEADFNIPDDGHPDYVAVPLPEEVKSETFHEPGAAYNQGSNGGNSGNKPMPPSVNQFSRTGSMGNNPPRQPPPQPQQQQQPRPNNINSFPGAGTFQNGNAAGGPRPQNQFNQGRPAAPPNASKPNPTSNPQAFMTPQRQQPSEEGGFEDSGFFSARAALAIPEDALKNDNGNLKPAQGQVFNPKAETKSIPRTPGVDHTKSKPVARNLQHVPPKQTEGDGGNLAAANKPAGPSMQPPRPGGPAGNNANAGPRPGPMAVPGARPAGMINPQLDQTRRIGAPGSSSPLGNRGQFRPPTVKRPPGADGPSPANGTGGPTGNSADDPTKRDLKRQRTS
ncbi:hypothetical protein VTJ83DRAFT_3591 [Remersonia thermophila]|uniref:Uncharacterized protein n=1 Tax=Remersonia thermophila TaxID=72144 RepID=A0ABR4DEF8_9PEZI